MANNPADPKTVSGCWTRREFMTTLAGSSAAFLVGPSYRASAGAQVNGNGDAPVGKKIAILATVVRKYSHAQHFIDRFLEGYGWHGKHYYPGVDLVSLYVDQFPKNDLSRDRVRRHPVALYPTIAEALTLGGSRLAVDGVLIIAEHGDYPTNAKGQKLYPRYRFFKEVIRVFEQSGRSVPVFNDKHLSTDWAEAKEMVTDARRIGFPFMAGSSLPVTWRIPSLEVPRGAELTESLCACYGGVDSYDIHGLETAQCMSERREGGEAGVRSVHAVKGEQLWGLLEQRKPTQQLLWAALARSHTLRPPDGYTTMIPELKYLRRACPRAIGYFIEHRDGFQTTMLLLNGLIRDFNYAGRLRGTGEILSCQMYLPMPPRQTTLASFFSPLVHHIEKMILTGEPPYPVERTLLTTGMTLFGVESLYRGQVPLLTPELEVTYQPSAQTTFWRA